MAKLTDTQLIVLSAAAARDDGAAVVAAKMNRAAVSKFGASLITRKLMREARAKPGMPVWRQSEDGRFISLIITRESREKHGSTAEKRSRDGASRSHLSDGGAMTPHAGTKQALVISMLWAKGGVTLDALVAATGWLPHTTRAALTGLRKRGFAIERTREEGSDSIYRIVSAPAAAAA
jgi:hypothetical protein